MLPKRLRFIVDFCFVGAGVLLGAGGFLVSRDQQTFVDPFGYDVYLILWELAFGWHLITVIVESLNDEAFLGISRDRGRARVSTGQDVFAVAHEQVCFNTGAGAVTGEAVVQKNGLNLFDIKLNLLSRELLRCVFILSYHRKTNKEKYGNGRQSEDHLSTCIEFS